MLNSDKQKEQHLRNCVAWNAAADAVTDGLFADSDFFDPRDLLLVKYEMLRRVRVDCLSVMEAAQRFGFSLESGFTLLEELFLPLIKLRWLDLVLVAQVGHRLAIDQMSLHDRRFLLSGDVASLSFRSVFHRFLLEVTLY